MDLANSYVTQSPRQDFECRPHGLRKAADRSLAEAGCTQHEIMSALGLKTLAEVEPYTGQANQSLMAGDAVAKLRTTDTTTSRAEY